MPIADDDLEAVVAELASRPGHEKVRSLLYRILIEAFGARSEQIAFERRIPEVNGRMDALLGRTVIEIKSDLRREGSAAEAQLTRYLPERERATGQRYVGLATDGATFVAYEMRDGTLFRLTAHEAGASKARRLTAWLEGVIAVSDWLPADEPGITNELGRTSAAFARTLGLLEQAWDGLAGDAEALLKRQLWSRHLGFVYGKAIDDDTLWLQHTYLVILAKAIAAGAMGHAGSSPFDLLSGRRFQEAGVHGAVEDDFFGWILQAPGGERIVASLAAHTARFDLGSVDVDLLKVLYESLIDPEQRHDLGEYYTPDWLALKVVRRALDDPADQTCLDPACGSGSFLFHAVRLKREALAAAGVPMDEVAGRCCAAIHGFDVHPVAVIFARVTFLLALGPALPTRGGDISLPVYLGDALQWDVKRDAFESDLVVEVPRDPLEGKKGSPTLRFPLGLCAEPALFDTVLTAIHDASEAGRRPDAFVRQLSSLSVPVDQRETLRATFTTYDRLRRAGRDHIWGFVARNLSRPVALSEGARVDVVIGNPPWLSYRFMSSSMQDKFRETARRLGIWVGPDEARLVTQTDLSGLFFARAAELYARRPARRRLGGRVAMVLPLAALSRGQFRAFRTGAWTGVSVAFTEGWVLDNQSVSPLFRAPTCVLFADVTDGRARPTPTRMTAFAGRLPFKDAPEELADRYLRRAEFDAPTAVNFAAGSPYRGTFRNGATLYPRMLCLVTRVETSRIGISRKSPLVTSEDRDRKSAWKNVEALRGSIEVQFLKPIYLGESIAPYRVLGSSEGVVPMLADGAVLSAAEARDQFFSGLARWLETAEKMWDQNSSEKKKFKQQIDHYGKLSIQRKIYKTRIVFSKSGTLPAACIIRDRSGIIDHKLYWASIDSESEAYYLMAILNSEAARARIAHMQSRGEQGARDFDKLIFTLPIPLFDRHDKTHTALTTAGQDAERVAAAVAIPPGATFQRARGLIRRALQADGVADRIDDLVENLLGPMPRNEIDDVRGVLTDEVEPAAT